MALAAGGLAMVWQGPILLMRMLAPAERRLQLELLFDVLAIECLSQAEITRVPRTGEKFCVMRGSAQPLRLRWKCYRVPPKREADIEAERWRVEAMTMLDGKSCELQRTVTLEAADA